MGKIALSPLDDFVLMLAREDPQEQRRPEPDLVLHLLVVTVVKVIGQGGGMLRNVLLQYYPLPGSLVVNLQLYLLVLPPSESPEDSAVPDSVLTNICPPPPL